MSRSLRERLAQKRGVVREGDQQGEWYVLHTYSGYENKVRQNLLHRVETMDVADKVFEVVIPMQEEIEIRGGQRHTVQRKVFPGYVLVRMILDDESWHVVRNTPGVTGFVGVGNRPVPLDRAEAEAIIRGAKAEQPKVRMTLLPGDVVRIIDGPFTDFRGVVDEVDNEKGKVRVLVSFFGRETPVTLDFLQVERET
ncbi:MULTISPECIES: transcription termination/antitermination protein NusG [Thermomicrobium]|jgi:transcriptional antiterminator NusG|nr:MULTISPECIES: transcription termination/antitermination protein NusG [Thermomicrobium]MBO9306882.1 transcription termination/antitermination factor NusG [Thermomicrobium sp.]MBO9359319.1 transcription termination/antitermination factor NusG [Thermomicrobium sp.]MBO9386351.1 transcription termination/antitermination factor NusG [Thermomicrobium sp.]